MLVRVTSSKPKSSAQAYVWASGRDRPGSHGPEGPPITNPFVLRHSRALVAVEAVVDEEALPPVMVPLRFR